MGGGLRLRPRCDNAEDDCLTEVSGSAIPLEYDGPGRELRCRHPLPFPTVPAGATALGLPDDRRPAAGEPVLGR